LVQENLEEYVTDGISYSLNDYLDDEVIWKLLPSLVK
jgi:hypothetical protein